MNFFTFLDGVIDVLLILLLLLFVFFIMLVIISFSIEIISNIYARFKK